MALRPIFTCNLKPHFHSLELVPKVAQPQPRRRESILMATVASFLFAKEMMLDKQIANGLEVGGFKLNLQMVAPDQTLEEALGGIKSHVQGLLEVKDLIEKESWKETQKELRTSGPKLKQDIYTIIQAKPGIERPLLRKLYFNLFNNVTKMDYAARDEDALRVRQCYEDMVLALNDILSKI